MAQIITQTSQEDAAGLSKSLQSVISPAIAKEIADNKDTMIDALYPIMGGMISKYVTQAIKEMVETINNKIEDGLSFDKYKRKLKSKVTGVSETELLMEESSDTTISSIFIIHKKSGLLIAEAHLEDKEIDDAHMVASMASAIKDFINDWIKSNESQNEIQILSYGNATLYIESAGSVYVIAFLDAEPDYEQRTKINTFFASIVKEYASFFQYFGGDDSADEIVNLSKQMNDYIYAQSSRKQLQTEQKSKIDPAKYMLYFLAFVLLFYSVYQLNDWYTKDSLEHAVYAQTGEEISISEEEDHLVLHGQVASMDVIYEIERIMEQHSKEKIKNNLIVPMTYIDKRLKNGSMSSPNTLHELENKLELLERSFEKSINALNEKVLTVTIALKNSEKYLTKLEKATENELAIVKKDKTKFKRVVEIENEIFTRLDKAFCASVFYEQKDHSLDFRKLTLFPAGKSVYEVEAMKVVTEIFTRYMSIMVEYKEYIQDIIIEGHTDSTGVEEDNIILSEKRALAVKYYLERLSIVKQYDMQYFLKTKGYGSAKAIVVNGVEDKDASRRIKMKFVLKKVKY